jgi:surface antigen
MSSARLAARFAALVACCLLTATPAFARFWQCAPYAREISGIDIHGNANTWWSQAAGRYARGQTPRVGAVLSMASSRRMPMGHVAMVSRVIGDREVLLTHANWSRRGGVESDVRAIDVSPNNDWTEVRVWYGPIGDLGTSSNRANGFIYADEDDADALPKVTIASVAAVPVAAAPAAAE